MSKSIRLTFTLDELKGLYILMAGHIASVAAGYEIDGRSAMEIRTLTAETRALQGRIEDALSRAEEEKAPPLAPPSPNEAFRGRP